MQILYNIKRFSNFSIFLKYFQRKWFLIPKTNWPEAGVKKIETYLINFIDTFTRFKTENLHQREIKKV